MPLITALWRQRQVDLFESQARSGGATEGSCLKAGEREGGERETESEKEKGT